MARLLWWVLGRAPPISRALPGATGPSLVAWSFGAETARKGCATQSRGERRRLVGFISDFHPNRVTPVFQMPPVTFRIKPICSVWPAGPQTVQILLTSASTLWPRLPLLQSPSHLGIPTHGWAFAHALPSAVTRTVSFPSPSLPILRPWFMCHPLSDSCPAHPSPT